MQGSSEIYEELINRIEQQAPPLAAQIREEVARGRLVKGSQLPTEERLERQSRLTEASLGSIGREEMAVLPYTGDQRLALLCQTLTTLAHSMTESRRALLNLAEQQDLPSRTVRFTEADEAQSVEFDLTAELARATNALTQVAELLAPVQQELGPWH